MNMFTDQETCQPWQIFGGLFVCFWVTSAYFDHFLFTGVFCIVFGVVAEIVTKEMYGENSGNKQKQKTQLVTAKSIEDKMAKNADTWLKADDVLEAEENDEDDMPPPLPDKDYETGKLDTLSAKLQALVDTSKNEADESYAYETVPSAARQFNRTVSDENNQNTSFLNSNLLNDINNSIIEEETNDQRTTVEDSESYKQSEQKIYAPDSSDDEEEDEEDDDFVSREVNFDDSESEGDDFDEYVKHTSQVKGTRNPSEFIAEESSEDLEVNEFNDQSTIIIDQTIELKKSVVDKAYPVGEMAPTTTKPVT